MDSVLAQIVDLIKKALLSSSDSSYIIALVASGDDKVLITELVQSDCVQEITRNGAVISAEEIDDTTSVTVEIIYFGLKKYGYYDSFEEFVNNNEFSSPSEFYIRNIDYLHDKTTKPLLIKSYFAIIKLIDCLSDLSLFQSNEEIKTLYLMQEKSATALPVEYDFRLIEETIINLDDIEGFTDGVTSTGEKKKIYLKELIDYLNSEQTDGRFKFLYQSFSIFYQKCEAAYAFFLSDFSYSKLKLELESSILDYSKNIRSIINDSQSKLIAIPAAFIVASTQLNLESAFAPKNFLIVISSFVFSVLIEIFIRNQESSLNIFVDNVNNYKTTFRLKNTSLAEKENDTLQHLISMTFQSIDNELTNQKDRLNLVRCVNWAMSIFLVLIIIYTYKAPTFKAILSSLIFLAFNTHCTCLGR